MISIRYYVSVISIASLLSGCFSTEKKKEFKKNKITPIVTSDINNIKENIDYPSSAINHEKNNTYAPSETIGTTNINMPLKKNSFSNSSFDILLPIKNIEGNVIFSQLGVRRNDKRNIVNIGIGQRCFFNNVMLGFNTFYDTQISGSSHHRAGIGVELWSDYLKLSANGYRRLSGWKSSSLLNGGQERVANGFDIMAETYLPYFPQLGAKVKYEHYFGNNVATVSHNDRYKDPSALTVGINFTPVPLVTLGIDQSRWSDGKSETRANIGINYRLNVPLSQQLNPHFTPRIRTLANSRLDKVQRNNDIVFEYQAKERVQFHLPAELKGFGAERKNVLVSFTGKYGLGRVDWDDSALKSRGGGVIRRGTHTYQVQLPEYDNQGNNYFTLSAIAYDKQGNASNSSEMRVLVERHQVMVESDILPMNNDDSDEDEVKQLLQNLISDKGKMPQVDEQVSDKKEEVNSGGNADADSISHSESIANSNDTVVTNNVDSSGINGIDDSKNVTPISPAATPSSPMTPPPPPPPPAVSTQPSTHNGPLSTSPVSQCAPLSPKGQSTSQDLMAEIRKGLNLKKVDIGDKKPDKKSNEPIYNSIMNNIHANIQARRPAHDQSDNELDDQLDQEWND